MGKVYRAYDRDIDRTVALKLVRPEFAMDTMAMARFRQELLLASKVSHRNILRIHDLGDVDGIKFISMAFVEGKDLHDAICEAGKLPFDRALKIARQLCSALDAAHAEGVVHRDLKPRNILLDSMDQVYVSDFGLAKSVEAQAAAMTRTGDILGTPLYMSPEQIEAKDVDHRSDLYSLGLIFFEMVTGDIPFPGKSSVQVMHARMNLEPKNPKDICPNVPDFFCGVIAKCLVKDVNHRYQHASEILHDLEAAVAPKRRFIDRLPKLNRTWGLVAAAVALAIGGTLATTVAVPRLRDKVFGGRAVAKGPKYYMAILPFKPLGDNEELKYQAEGIVEALNAKLFSLTQVQLASSNNVDRAMGKGSIDKIARELGANLLVQGTVQRGGDRIAITVSAWDKKTATVIWQQSFQCAPESLLTTEDDIYNALVDKLQLKLSDKEMARGAARATEDSKAYDVYMRGRSLIRGKATVENYQASLELFNQATAKDPRFARAYAGMAESNFGLYRLTKDPQWSEKGLGAAQQAESLDRDLPEVHMIVGSAYLLKGKYAEAIAEYNRTVDLAPNSDEAYRRLGNAYAKAKNKELAIQNLVKATEINPYSYLNFNALGYAYNDFGDYDKAVEAFEKVTQLQPDFAGGYTNLAAILYQQGKWAECIPYYKKALELEPSARTYQNLGVLTLNSGNSAEAVKLLEEAAKRGPKDHVNFGNLGDAYSAVGQTAKATQAYETAISLAYNAWKLNSKDSATLGSLALYYAKKGDFTQATTFIVRARAIDPESDDLMYNQGVIDHLAGRDAEALVELKLSFEKGYPAREAENEFALRTLRTNPEFQKLLAAYSNKK
jgi:eukaryotic-like serine/threonine-protein kinase